MHDRLRILIIDDHPITRSGMRLLLERQLDFDVVGEANCREDALAMIMALHPEVVIIECMMADVDSLKLTSEIRTKWPDMPILAIAIHRADGGFLDMMRAGASGYIIKDAELEDLSDAIKVVSEGKVWLSPAMALVLVQEFRHYANTGSGWGNGLVTSREKEILRMLADGYSVSQVAERLVISPSTVHTHRSNIMAKLGLEKHSELIEQAKRRGLVHNNNH